MSLTSCDAVSTVRNSV